MQAYVEAAGRRGITPDAARTIVRTNATVIAALAVRRGDADAMICGLEGRFMAHLRHIRDVIGLAPGVRDFAALSARHHQQGRLFHHRHPCHARADCRGDRGDGDAWRAAHVRRFGIPPKIALLSHSDFGSYDSPSAAKMRAALAILLKEHPELEVEGEMKGDTALNPALRERVFPNSRLKGEANVLIMPNLDAANIAYQMTKVLADALPVGPILMGAACPAHILTPSVTARGVINMTALAVVEAQGVGPV